MEIPVKYSLSRLLGATFLFGLLLACFPKDLDSYLRTDSCAHGASGAPLAMFNTRREISAFVKTFLYRDDPLGAGGHAICASLAQLRVYPDLSSHLTLDRSSPACCRDMSVTLPLSILAISSCLSLSLSSFIST